MEESTKREDNADFKNLNERIVFAKDNNKQFVWMYFGQVPVRTADEFLKLANELYSGHFGFCLQALIDQMIIQQNVVSELKIEEIDERLLNLEKMYLQLEEKSKKEDVTLAVRKRVGGVVELEKNGA